MDRYGYIGIETLLKFCENSKDHAVTPNDFMMMPRKAVKNMVVPVPTEVIPVWYIEKWKKEKAEDGSALSHFLEQLIKDYRAEEARMTQAE